MTEKLAGWVRQNVLAIGLILFTAGGAWTLTHVQISGKADKVALEAIAADVRIIKTLVCRDHPGDSACLPTPGARP